MKTITTLPNQSMMDVIEMACGSLEAMMDFCVLNDVALSDVPVPGTEYLVPNSVFADAATLLYNQQNAILIGTLGQADPASTLITEDGEDALTEEGGSDVLIAD